MSGPTPFDRKGTPLFTDESPGIVQLADLMDYISEMRDLYYETQQALTEAQSYHYFVSVKEYGAKGDGVTDDTLAIQTAINENPNRTVFFPCGVYLISSPLQVPHKMRLEGESRSDTIIQVNTNIHMMELFNACELIGFTFKINMLTHTSSVLRYFARQGGSKNGLVRDIYIIGLDGYQNQTKAIEFCEDPKWVTGNNRSFAFWWTFEDIFIEFCETGWYTQADFSKCWTTAVSFTNMVVERCKRGIYFNSVFAPGYFSRYDFIGFQFQYSTQSIRAFEGPLDRSILDIHIWDRSVFPATPKSIYLKGPSRNNKFFIRNVDTTQVEIEKPSASIRNTFDFSDDPKISKNLMLTQTIHVNATTGDDANGDGSLSSPYKTINNVIGLLPLFINGFGVDILIADGTYNETITLANFYGGGQIRIRGTNVGGTKINGISSTNNRVKMTFEKLVTVPNNNGNGVLLTDSEYTYFFDVSVEPLNGNIPSNGYFVQGTPALIRNPNILNCAVAFEVTSSAQVRLDAHTGSGNTTAYSVRNAGVLGRTVAMPSNFATNQYNVTSGGIASSNVGIKPMANQVNSSTTDLVTLRNEYNALLQKMRDAGLMV